MAGNTLTGDPAWNVVTQRLNVGARSAVTSRASAAIWSTLGVVLMINEFRRQRNWMP
jgi:hypothetical protein